jgi:transcription elongation factor GreA
MTTQPALENVRIGQLRDEFLRSDAAKALAPDDPARLRKFVAWCGISTNAASLQPYKIEEFLQQQLNTSIPPRTYMPGLKAFFGWAFKTGAIASDPMKTVRLPRGAGARKASATPVHASPSATPPKAGGRDQEVLYVTRDRLDLMHADLERMRTEERDRISHMLHEAIKDGDLSENAGYDDAKMQQGLLEARIRELESKVRSAQIIEDQVASGPGVSVGGKVTLEEIESGDRVDYTVVGPEEANPRTGKISDRSPVGRAVLGKGPGDEVEVTTPGGSVRYRIVSVS